MILLGRSAAVVRKAVIFHEILDLMILEVKLCLPSMCFRVGPISRVSSVRILTQFGIRGGVKSLRFWTI